MSAALEDLTGPEDIASAAYLFNSRRPTVIRIRRDEGTDPPAFLCIYEDDGLAAPRHPFETIDELGAIVRATPDDDPTYALAAASIIDQFVKTEGHYRLWTTRPDPT